METEVFENEMVVIGEVMVCSLMMMYCFHLLLCHTQLYETVTTFDKLEVCGRECTAVFQSKQTSERMKPQ
jgi:hypothetical protein